MIINIGIVSGEILNFLEVKKEPVSITEIKFHLDDPIELINMSIGWLIREKYVHLIRRGSEQYLAEVLEDDLSSEMAENIEHVMNI